MTQGTAKDVAANAAPHSTPFAIRRLPDRSSTPSTHSLTVTPSTSWRSVARTL